MQSFDYIRAASVDDAVAGKLRAPGASYIGGGTNLIDLMKMGIARPTTVIDLADLPLKDIAGTPDGGLRIGAQVTNSALVADPLVQRLFPLLAQAVLNGASAQIRNKATVAGNLMQRTRCAYFYALEMPCNKRAPGQGCAARGGYNRYHAIFGTSTECIATHPSDMAVAMTALDARIEVSSGAGRRRTVPIADFYRLPGNKPQVDNELAPAELITGVVLPPPVAKIQLYRKVRDRTSYAFAVVSVAAVVKLDSGRIERAQLAFGGVAARPWTSSPAEQALVGQEANERVFEAAAHEALAGATPLPDNLFKVALLQRTIVDVLDEAKRSN